MTKSKDILDKIWETKKTRINTENRLKRYSKCALWFIPYYSIYIIFISIFPKFESNKQIQVLSIIGSIVILVISIITSLQKYDLCAHKFKIQYLALDSLYNKYKDTKYDNAKVIKEYSEILSETENHETIDYIRLIVSRRKQETTLEKPVLWHFMYLYLYSIAEVVIATSLLLFPIITTIILLQK
jgi:hypothetical protein